MRQTYLVPEGLSLFYSFEAEEERRNRKMLR